MTGESTVTSMSERCTYSLIFLRFGLVSSTRHLQKFVQLQPSVRIVIECVMLKTSRDWQFCQVPGTNFEGQSECRTNYCFRAAGRQCSHGKPGHMSRQTTL
jgi:hypothetical protein